MGKINAFFPFSHFIISVLNICKVATIPWYVNHAKACGECTLLNFRSRQTEEQEFIIHIWHSKIAILVTFNPILKMED